MSNPCLFRTCVAPPEKRASPRCSVCPSPSRKTHRTRRTSSDFLACSQFWSCSSWHWTETGHSATELTQSSVPRSPGTRSTWVNFAAIAEPLFKTATLTLARDLAAARCQSVRIWRAGRLSPDVLGTLPCFSALSAVEASSVKAVHFLNVGFIGQSHVDLLVRGRVHRFSPLRVG